MVSPSVFDEVLFCGEFFEPEVNDFLWQFL
jgi:hypothetical protein